MRNLAHKYCFLADTLSDWVGKTCMWSAAIGMLIMIYEVFTRYVFHMANDWVFETTIMIYAFHFCMWISPEFQLYVVKEYQLLKEQEKK